MVTRGVDGGPGLSGLVVHTNTSLGLLFPSMFDAMSCRERNAQYEGFMRGECKVRKRKWKEKKRTKGEGKGDRKMVRIRRKRNG